MQQKRPPWLWPHFEKRRPHCRSFTAVKTDLVWTIYTCMDVTTRTSDMNGCQCLCNKSMSIGGRHGVSYNVQERKFVR